MQQKILNFLLDEDGLTMVEYAIAGSLVGLAAVAAFTLLGENVATQVDNMADVVVAPTP